MKIIFLTSIILSVLLLTGCSEQIEQVVKPEITPQDCKDGLIFTKLTYQGFGKGKCLTQDTINSLIMKHCIENIKNFKIKDDNIKKLMFDDCLSRNK